MLLAAGLLAGCAGAMQTTPAAGTDAGLVITHSASAPAITLDARTSGPSVSADVYGASLDTWFDFVQPFVDPSFAQTGIHLVRFPGGSESDVYHWEGGGSLCAPKMGYIAKPSTFENLASKVTGPLGIDVAITLNYGSNRHCNGGGEPSEAAAWVAEAKQRGYNVPYWTVGNEVYGSWEFDLHRHKHDPITYSRAFRDGYYPVVKAADPTVKLGVVGDFALAGDRHWNDIVFRRAAPFDFVEIHYYPEYNIDSDSFLLGPALDRFASELAGVRAQMKAAGLNAHLPIYLGEFNNDAGQEGKQSVSIVNGLYLGQMLGILMNAGVPMATWWLAYGSCDESGDYSNALYGWQHFGSEGLFSDGLPDPYDGCSNTPKIPAGTPYPAARVMALFHATVPPGSSIRTVAVASPLEHAIRAYGFAEGNGYAFVLFNNTLSGANVMAVVRNATRQSYAATLWVYGKAQYDLSKNDRWVGAAEHHLGSVGARVPIMLPPYSMSVLQLR
ncbi:MAG: hypothetical protein JO302_02130 [Candidatus Eremiobacteraeota bacterium]|nr:hypothetical protein [Candidatus Eremiobacteraeota bacterium]